jgi:hypothetical protein
MFEKVAIDIYSHLNKVEVNEFGLLINDKINNFGASPDGITNEGIMIEFMNFARDHGLIVNNIV